MGIRQRLQLIGSLFLLFGLVSGSWFCWLFGGFFFFMTWFQGWWHNSLQRWVSVSWEVEQSRVMPDTPVQVRLRLTNRSWLPLPYTRIKFSLPEHVIVEGADETELVSKRLNAQIWLSAPRRSQAERILILRPQKRGVLWLTEVQAELIDLMGGESCQLEFPLSFSLLVYPQTIPVPAFALADTDPTGRRLSRQRLQEDVTFLRGIRPYAPGDRLKQIDWKASAKTRQLQTRQFEFSSHANWRIIGHILPSYEPLRQSYNEGINERVISCIAAVAARCRRENLAYELLVSVRQRKKEYFQLAKGSGKAHFLQVMTHLARLNQYIPSKLASVLRRLEQSGQKEAILIISPRIEETDQLAMQRLVRRGHTVVLMEVAEDAVNCRRIAPKAPVEGGLVHES